MVWLQVNRLVYNIKSPLFILCISMVFPIISILETFYVMLQNYYCTFNYFIFKICHLKTTRMQRRNHINDIIDRVNKLIDDNDINELMLPGKIKLKDINQHINIEEFYRRDYYRIIDMVIESIHTYFNATDINIYKQIEQIFTNTEHNIDIYI